MSWRYLVAGYAVALPLPRQETAIRYKVREHAIGLQLQQSWKRHLINATVIAASLVWCGEDQILAKFVDRLSGYATAQVFAENS